MTTMPIVESLDELEDGKPSLSLGAPYTPVDEFALQRREETLGQRVVVAISYRAHGGANIHRPTPLAKRNRGILGTLVGMMDHALIGTSLAQGHIERIEHQLTPQVIGHRPAHTRRLYTSSTTARNKNPVQVGTYLISATHSRSGPSALKSRSTRSGAGRASGLRSVVRTRRRRLTPQRPSWRINRATRLRLTLIPSASSSACTRGTPYVPRLA